MEQPKTLREAIRYFADPDNCIRYLAESRWPDGVVVCPTCGRKDVSYVAKRRVWQCKSQPVLHGLVAKHISNDATLFTDEWSGYKGVDLQHEFVNHADTYVRGLVHTNGLENFWSLLKRGLAGTYVSVEPFHLFRYIDEQAFRYNNRATADNPLNDADRFALVVSQIVGRRITYKELTGKADARPF
jgi:transposase-like protein